MASEPTTAAQKPSMRRRLGRGLGSLISAPVKIDLPDHPVADVPSSPPAGAEVATPSERPENADPAGGLRSIAIHLIQPNPKQPRQHFDEQSLQALASSIAASGVMQPIVVRQIKGQGGAEAFEIIAGERRWRAAQLAGLQRIPAVVRDVDDRTAAELSLVENIQREDLNPMERADAFRRLIEEFGLSQQEVAQRVGLDRSSVSNHLRLHELDEQTKEAVRKGMLNLGHAKALLAITNIAQRRAIAAQALRMGWSVREVERRAKLAQSDGEIGSAPRATQSRNVSPAAANAADLERRLSEHLGTRVHLHPGRSKGSGKLVIEFFNLDQFEGLLRRMQFEVD